MVKLNPWAQDSNPITCLSQGSLASGATASGTRPASANADLTNGLFFFQNETCPKRNQGDSRRAFGKAKYYNIQNHTETYQLTPTLELGQCSFGFGKVRKSNMVRRPKSLQLRASGWNSQRPRAWKRWGKVLRVCPKWLSHTQRQMAVPYQFCPIPIPGCLPSHASFGPDNQALARAAVLLFTRPNFNPKQNQLSVDFLLAIFPQTKLIRPRPIWMNTCKAT